MKFTLFLFTLFCSLAYSITAYANCTNQGIGLVITKPDDIYTNNGDATVSDTNTGLMWQVCPLGLSGADCATGTLQTLTWPAALAGAVADTSSGYTDWRLPNKNELISLVDYACTSPAINDSVFPATIPTPLLSLLNDGIFPAITPVPGGGGYWSSTPVIDNSGNALIWAVDFVNGFTIQASKDNNISGYVRLVRGFELLDPTLPAPPPL